MEVQNGASTPTSEELKLLANEAFKGKLLTAYRWEVAVGCLNQSLNSDFPFIQCGWLVCLTLLAAHKYGQSVELYTRAIELNSQNAVYWANRAFAHTKLEEYGSAIQDATKAIEIDPKYSKATFSSLRFFIPHSC